MQPLEGNGPSAASVDQRSAVPDRVATLASRVDEIDSLLRTATEVVDEKTLKELRRTVDALAKRDPKFEERVTNKVDVMADRVEMLAKTVSTSSAALVAKEGAIVQLRRELEAALARVDSVAAGLGRGADATELADVRRALDDLSKLTKQKLPRGLESRVDDLAGKFAQLAQRVDTVSTTISTTASGLAGREGEVTALRRAVEGERDRVAAELADLRRAVDPKPVADLRRALKELADETARQQYSIRQLVAQSGASVDAVAGRVESLTASVTATTDRVSGTDEALAAFRAYFEDVGERVTSHLTAHQRSLDALSSRAAALEQVDEEAARVLDEHMTRMSGKVDDLAGRLDSFTAALTETADRVSGHEEGVSALRAYVGDAGRQLGALLDDQKQSLTALAERTAELEHADHEVSRRLEERISAASDRIDELARGLEPLVQETSAQIASRIEALDARLTAADTGHGETASELARVAAIVEVDRASIRARLDTLAGALERSGTTGSDELERRLAEMQTARDAERASFQAQFDAVADALASSPPPSALEQRLEELGRRLEEVEQRSAAVAAKVSHASALLPTALRSLEARLDEVAPELRRTGESSQPSTSLTPIEGAPEVAQPDPAGEAVAAIVPLRLSDP
jgi:predicted  nucleic acid-binding Zn-ribbon protein